MVHRANGGLPLSFFLAQRYHESKLTWHSLVRNYLQPTEIHSDEEVGSSADTAQTMRYFGSKVSTAQQVYRYIADRVPTGSFCDPFGGVGVIGAYFKKRGFSVVSGDILTHAHFFQTARIARQRRPAFLRLRKELGLESADQIVELLNRAKRHDGWFVREYAEERMFFTRSNAERIAGCRASIFAWAKQGLLSHSEKAVLVASLIDSMDRVANTAGTYYAYLKHWYRKARQPFRFSLIPHASGSRPCRAYLADARDLVARRHFDVLYLDPPVQ